MNEDFVPFELAKKLKEKGFNEPCMNAINRFGCTYRNGWCEYLDDRNDEFITQRDLKDGDYLLPTISQVLKWLREEKAISVEPYASASGWRVTICRAYHQDRCDAGGGTCLKEEVIGYNDGGAFEKYEEAAIAGIEYCLDDLI